MPPFNNERLVLEQFSLLLSNTVLIVFIVFNYMKENGNEMGKSGVI